MKTQNEYYFDNAATTKVYDEVREVMEKTLKNNYYNPSSFYKPAIKVEKQIEDARKNLAELTGFSTDEIFFTSGATESNNTIIRGIIDVSRKPFNIITSQIEHPSVMEVFKHYENRGVDTRYIPVDSYGNLDLNWLKENVDKDTTLVSIMAVNNEIGTILDLIEAKKIVKEKNPKAIFHTDFTQAFLKTQDIDLKELKPDALSVSAHKIHGPKGVGLFALRKGIYIPPLLIGGGQERGFRSGTENTAGIIGFSKAAEILSSRQSKVSEHTDRLRKHLLDRVTAEIDDVLVNSPENSISAVVSLSFSNIRAEVLLHMLESENMLISAGSACSTHHKDSYVHNALNFSKDRSDGTIRISFSEFNTIEEVDRLVDLLVEKVKYLRHLLGIKK